jgi:hypothetical protein
VETIKIRNKKKIIAIILMLLMVTGALIPPIISFAADGVAVGGLTLANPTSSNGSAFATNASSTQGLNISGGYTLTDVDGPDSAFGSEINIYIDNPAGTDYFKEPSMVDLSNITGNGDLSNVSVQTVGSRIIVQFTISSGNLNDPSLFNFTVPFNHSDYDGWVPDNTKLAEVSVHAATSTESGQSDTIAITSAAESGSYLSLSKTASGDIPVDEPTEIEIAFSSNNQKNWRYEPGTVITHELEYPVGAIISNLPEDAVDDGNGTVTFTSDPADSNGFIRGLWSGLNDTETNTYLSYYRFANIDIKFPGTLFDDEDIVNFTLNEANCFAGNVVKKNTKTLQSKIEETSIPGTASVSSNWVVFKDLNGDSKYVPSDDEAYAGIDVGLFATDSQGTVISDVPVKVTDTASDGKFQFTALSAGTYTVKASLPVGAGYSFAPKGAGGTVSTVDVDGYIESFSLGAGEAKVLPDYMGIQATTTLNVIFREDSVSGEQIGNTITTNTKSLGQVDIMPAKSGSQYIIPENYVIKSGEPTFQSVTFTWNDLNKDVVFVVEEEASPIKPPETPVIPKDPDPDPDPGSDPEEDPKDEPEDKPKNDPKDKPEKEPLDNLEEDPKDDVNEPESKTSQLVDDEDDEDDQEAVLAEVSNPVVNLDYTPDESFGDSTIDGGTAGSTDDSSNKFPNGGALWIGDNPIPLLGDGEGSWALINLVLTIGGLLMAIGMFIVIFKKKRNGESSDIAQSDNEHYGHMGEKHKRNLGNKAIFLIFAITLSIACLLLFILTQDISLNMTLADIWTLLSIVIFIIEAVCVHFAMKEPAETYEDADYYKTQASYSN